MNFKLIYVSTIVLSVAITCATGCGDSGKPDLADAKARLAKTNSFLDIYKSVNGDWDKLSADQKAEVIKIQGGSEVKAHAAFIGASQGPTAAQQYIAAAQSRGEK